MIVAIACSISNMVETTKEQFDQRENRFEKCIERLKDRDLTSKLLTNLMLALAEDPEQDFLGETYSKLNLSKGFYGQSFTPYHVAELMAKMTLGEDANEAINKQRYISVLDPTCGAGVMLIAASNILSDIKNDYRNHVLFIGQDIDETVGLMCYIQISLLGLAGYVCIGNTLTDPINTHNLFPQETENMKLWKTPMFYSPIWDLRRKFYMLENLVQPSQES